MTVRPDVPTTAVQVSQFYVTLLNNNKATGANLGADVFYGDQTKISGPRTACVEPGQKSSERTRSASGMAVKRTYQTYVYVYSNYTSSETDNRLDSDLTAEAIEKLVHQYPTCGGLVNSVLVETIEPGYVTKITGTTYVASRLTISAIKEEFLPQSLE